MKRQADLYLLGIGIGGPDAMTVATKEAIKSARVVFDMSDKPHMLADLNSNRIFLDDTYWSGRPFLDVYAEIQRIVLEEVEKGPGVAMVGYGHPIIFDCVNNELAKMARKRGKTVCVMPAVSCLDTICIDMGLDLASGLQIFEANDLVERRLRMNPKVESLVLQVGYFDVENTDEDIEFELKHFNPLIKLIAKHYGEDQKVTLVHSDDGDGAESFNTKIKNLDRHRARILTSMTMYIPAHQD